MKTVTRELGTRNYEGKPYNVVRNFFVYEDKTNYLVQAQSYFTKEEKKIAKAQYEQNKGNMFN